MSNPLRTSYKSRNPAAGEMGLAPYLPMILTNQSISINVSGLVDTGAAVNVLPYSVGLTLGAIWDESAPDLRLGGNLDHYPAHPLILAVTVGNFDPALLAFAWTQFDEVPIILGQMNFFLEFDVCFFRAQRAFEVQPKQ